MVRCRIEKEGSISKLYFMIAALLILWGEKTLSTIIILLCAWLVLNAAFVAIRFYITANQDLQAEQDLG